MDVYITGVSTAFGRHVTRFTVYRGRRPTPPRRKLNYALCRWRWAGRACVRYVHELLLFRLPGIEGADKTVRRATRQEYCVAEMLD